MYNYIYKIYKIYICVLTCTQNIDILYVSMISYICVITKMVTDVRINNS